MKKLLLFTAALMLSLSLGAQELANFVGTGNTASPEFKDGKITFRLAASYATRVQITGGFMPTQKVTYNGRESDVPITADMTRNAQGVWEYTIDMPAPELYTYNFIVDGVAVNDPSNVMQQRDGTRYLSILIVPGEFTENYFEANQRGNLTKVWYDSPSLGLNRRMYVYTPYGYDDPKNAKTKYPVLYLLHGGGGDEDAWSNMGRACQIMDNLIEKGLAVPMLIVMPNGNPNQQAASPLKLPVKEGQAVANAYVHSLAKDIVPYIEKHFRVKANKASRAVAGLSMGGGHTTAVTGLYPDLFDYICPMSCGMRDTEEAVAALQGIKKAGYKLYWVGCGNADFAYPGTKIMDEMLTRLDMPHTMYINGGGHTWSNWRHYLNTFGQLLFK